MLIKLLSIPTYNESEETEVACMREQKFHIYLDSVCSGKRKRNASMLYGRKKEAKHRGR